MTVDLEARCVEIKAHDAEADLTLISDTDILITSIEDDSRRVGLQRYCKEFGLFQFSMVILRICYIFPNNGFDKLLSIFYQN